jgi:FAD/FMN-containing dehydrogenase
MTATCVAVDPYLEDSSGYRGVVDRVFLPSDLSELREVVQACSSHQIPLTIAGAGTGLTGARVPRGGWVISLNKFRKIEIQHGRARCGAGVLLSDLQRAAAETNQFFGPNPTEDSASIGGIISTNAGGARSFHYGSVRRHVLSLTVTFMDSSTVTLRRGDRIDFPVRPVRVPATTKNSAGYYIRPNVEWVDLLAGSEGTLGIITEAELTLFPEPAAILSGVVFFPSEDRALDAVDAWRPISELRLLEFIDECALNLIRQQYPEIPRDARAALFIEQNLASEDDQEVDRWTRRLTEQDAFEDQSWFGFSSSDRERFRDFRHTLPVMTLDIIRRTGIQKAGTDFAVPINKYRELHAYYKQRCEEIFTGQYNIFGHVGDANNHVHVFPASPEQVVASENLMYEFAQYVVSLGGTIAAEHGIGKAKTNLLKLMYSVGEIQAMKDIKLRLDSNWLLGQGTIFEA